MVSLPAAVLLAAVAVDRLASLARRGARLMAGVLLVVLVAASAVGVAQWYSQGGPDDFRPAVALIADRAQPGDGIMIFAPYQRIPVEWYMADKPAAERIVHPVYPGTAWGVDPLSFDGYVRLPSHAVEEAASKYQRIWLVSATADLSLDPIGAASVEAALRRAGFSPAGTTHFRGVEVTKEVRQ
jgi:hypothetical protein